MLPFSAAAAGTANGGVIIAGAAVTQQANFDDDEFSNSHRQAIRDSITPFFASIMEYVERAKKGLEIAAQKQLLMSDFRFSSAVIVASSVKEAVSGSVEKALKDPQQLNFFNALPVMVISLASPLLRKDVEGGSFYNNRVEQDLSSTTGKNGVPSAPEFRSLNYEGHKLKLHNVTTSTNKISEELSDFKNIPESIKDREEQALESSLFAGAFSASPGPEGSGGGNNLLSKLKIPKISVSEAADIVTLILAVKDSLQSKGNNNNSGVCQPCCSTPPPRCEPISLSDNGKTLNSLPGKESLSSTLDGIRIDVNRLAKRFDDGENSHSAYVQSPYRWPEQSSLSSTMGEIRGNVQSLKDHFVNDASKQTANNEESKIESALKTVNATLNEIDNRVSNLADHFVRQSSDKTPGNKTQQPNGSLMLLANIAIDVKRMADQYVGSNLNHSSNGPVFQNILDTGWLSTTLNGIQESTNRTATLLPIQPNNTFNQTNNFTISGAQEPRVVAEAVRDNMPMLSDFSQANQILQVRGI